MNSLFFKAFQVFLTIFTKNRFNMATTELDVFVFKLYLVLSKRQQDSNTLKSQLIFTVEF